MSEGDMETRMQVAEDRLDDLCELVTGGANKELHPGIIGILERHSKTLDKFEGRLSITERTIDRFRWTMLGWTAGGAVFGGGIVAVVTRAIGT